MRCARTRPAVSGLEQEFPGKVVARNLDASTPEAQSDIQTLGFRSHGLVVRDPAGRVVIKQADHGVDIDAVRKALREALGS
jgi:hypothetical protein